MQNATSPNPRRLILAAATLIAFLSSVPSRAGELRVGAATMSITPDRPVALQGRAIELTAQVIAKHVRDRLWAKGLPKSSYLSEPRTVEITGDLARMLDEASPARETLALTAVGWRQDAALTPVTPGDSPVLLMGDSHTLVFHDPDLFAHGAGLPDHLALRLGFPVDLVGIRSSGATTTRIELLRRRDNLKGKKLVVWCFSCREFTESTTGWRKVPVIR